MAKAKRGAAIILAALLAVIPETAVRAQDVTLTSRNGAVELHGTLLDYDGEFYRIDTIYGALTLDADGVVCDGPGCPDPATFVAEFTVTGSTTIGATLMPALIHDYAAAHGLAVRVEEDGDRVQRYVLAQPETLQPVARIHVRLTSSDEGLIDLLAGDAQMALSLSELRDETVRAHVLALDAFVPIVGSGNPTTRLTLPQLTAVLAGEVRSWAAFGWRDVPIAVHARDARSGVQHSLEARLLGPLGLPLAEGAIRHDSDAALLAAVAADPFALGVAFWSDTGAATAVTLYGECGFDLQATPLTIKAEDYPLTAPLLLHTRAERLPLQVRRFVSHITGPAAQEAVRKAGFVDRLPLTQGIEVQGRRLANAVRAADGEAVDLDELKRLVADMERTERLSTTFRFESGTSALDIQSRSNVESLARDIEAGVHDGRELIFVGFTDGSGQPAANLRLARNRAEAVREAVLEAAPLIEAENVTLSVEAFGVAMPMACDDSEWGRRVNRRVEVWLR